jgi:hypothetical protein
MYVIIHSESGSQLKSIEAATLDCLNYRRIAFLMVLIIASDGVDDSFQISFADGHSCNEFGQ